LLGALRQSVLGTHTILSLTQNKLQATRSASKFQMALPHFQNQNNYTDLHTMLDRIYY